MMLKRPLVALALIFVLLGNTLGQQSKPTPNTPPQTSSTQNQQDDDDVVRITTNLVQVDAVVTDRNGKQITNLRAEDFEILENARTQPITNFSYITTGGPTLNSIPTTSTDSVPSRDRNALPVPPARLRPTQVQRTLALVIDDLGLSAESINDARRALRKYVSEQVQPNDLVAIIRTSAGVGALQQFTNDRQQLNAAIDRVRWNPRSVGGQTALAQFNTLDALSGSGETGDGTPDILPEGGVDASRVGLKELNEFRRELFTVGTLGTLNFVVRGLREMPGRKAVILFSDGFPLQDSRGGGTQYTTILQRLIDLANRASVVFYTIDARGLLPVGPTAADDTAGSPGGTGMAGGIRTDQIGQRLLSVRSGRIFEGQAGLKYLSRETGGISLINNNDLNLGIRRALDDMRGYYLLGYRPDESTFDPATGRIRFNRLVIKIKNRPDLTVRTRSGFLSVSEEATRPQPRTRGEQLMSALISPFGKAGVNMRLTSLFINNADGGSVIRSMLLIDPRTLTFTQQPDGQYQTVMDIIAVTFGENGQPIDRLNRIETIRVRPESFQRFLSEGMIYDLNVPIKRPGAYQLRIAVRDATTERVGAANQYVEVPDLNRRRLTLSGLVIASAPVESVVKASNAASSGKGAATNRDSQANPAMRRFHTGMLLDYGLVIYNARLDRTTRRPQLILQARLFREGQEVFAGQAQPFDPNQQVGLERIEAAGRLQLGSQLSPGEYVLQIIVTDMLADKQRRTATQWIDFELVN